MYLLTANICKYLPARKKNMAGLHFLSQCYQDAHAQTPWCFIYTTGAKKKERRNPQNYLMSRNSGANATTNHQFLSCKAPCKHHNFTGAQQLIVKAKPLLVPCACKLQLGLLSFASLTTPSEDALT